MRRFSLLLFSLILSVSFSVSALAAERVIWQIGKPDNSDHEFAPGPSVESRAPVVVKIGTGNEAHLWPQFQPGSANEAMGAHPYPYALVFDLADAPRGTFFLNLDVLFRHPRIPVMQVDVNGHQGDFYFSPRVSWIVGDENDAFNPIHSAEQRVIALPAAFLKRGENRLTLTCLDEPSTATRHITVGGPGDSGLYYDALSLTQDPDAAYPRRLEASFEPTVFFRKAAAGLEEECWLTVGYPAGWQGGKAKVGIKSFTTEVAAPKKAEFGETRIPVYVSDAVPAGDAEIELANTWAPGARGERAQSFTSNFTPQRKWKIFYAPHEHLDIGFTDYQAKVAEVHSRDIDLLLNTLEKHPDYRYNVDGSWIVRQWLATRTAQQAARFKQEASAGRIGVNAFYAGLLSGLLSQEEFFRSLNYSKFLGTRYDVPFDAAWLTDVPSYSWSVPSLLASAGIHYFAGGANQTRGPLVAYGHWNARSPFWWEGPDGQRVLAWYSYHYHQMRAVFGVPPSMAAGTSALPIFLQPYEHPQYAPDAVLLYGTEVENVPLDFQDADFVGRWNAQYAYPKIIPCRFGDFFDYIKEHYGSRLAVVRGDGGAYWEDGAGTDAIATGRYRSGETRALAGDALATLNVGLDSALRFPLSLSHDIWQNLMLYAEHTFTSWRGPGQPQHDEVVGQLEVKEGRTTRAASEIDQLVRRGMSQLGDQIGTQGDSLVVFNPLSWQRGGLVRFDVNTGTVLTDVSTRRPVSYEVVRSGDGYQSVRFWASDVPALGYKVYRMSQGPAIQPGRSEPESNIIQNKFYRLTFDPTRAAIKSIWDKQLSRELLNPESPYLANEYLYVTGGGDEKGRGNGSDATQLTHMATFLPYADLQVHQPEDGQLVSVEKTPWGHVVRMTAHAFNTPKIETDIYLYDDVKRIDIANHIHKTLTYAKEAAYFAFPWAASSPQFRFDIADGWVDPEKDMLEGADTEWFTPQNWVNVEDGWTSTTLAILDAPLVSLGDINRGRWPHKFQKESASVFSYALNNYWFTNTPAGQSGDFTFRYAITSSSRFDPVVEGRFGREARSPLEISEVTEHDKLPDAKGKLPEGAASLAAVAPDNLMISSLKGAEDTKGLIVRVYEMAGKDTDGRLTLPWFTVKSASEANAAEVPGKALEADPHAVQFHVKAHQVLTIWLTTE